MSALRVLSLLLLIALSAGSALADGIIIPIQPDPMPGPPPRLGEFYSVKYHRVSVDIHDQAAVTTVDQAFVNETDRNLEVQYIFPLPRGAAVSRFSLIVDGKEMPGRLLPKDEARAIYENIVRRHRDPALLEYLDNGMFQTNVFPLPPRGEREVILTYTELLSPDGDLVEYRYPLNTEKFSRKVLEEVRVDFTLRSGSPLKNVYSPTHEVRLNWDGETRVAGHWSDEGIKPEQDFRLFWTLSDDRVGATLFSYRPDPEEDGYFLLLASPRMDAQAQAPIPKDVVLVLDVSGSMQGEKLEQAKAAAQFVVNHLNRDDRFNLISYNSTVDPLWDEMRPCSDLARRDARTGINRLQAGGSTDIHGALTAALRQLPDEGRPSYLLFLTDGQPTAGITRPEGILWEVKEANRTGARLFAFGVGFDVNTLLLDRLGSDHSGLADYVPPGEDIEAKVSSFYSKVQNPALTDPQLDFADLRVRDAYPRELPDLFYGQTLILAGRYRDAGPRTVTLTGKTASETLRQAYTLDFARRTGSEDLAFVARLWAQRKIGWLIEEVRLHGSSKELVDEIVQLSTRYGIMTPYTSFLADENTPLAHGGGDRLRALGEVEAAAPMSTGAGGVSQSMESQRMKAAGVAPQAVQYRDLEGRVQKVEKVKIIGAKTFYLKQGEWIDAQYRPDMKTTEIRPFSDAWFDLAQADPEQAQYLSFAPDRPIVVVIGGRAYRLAPEKG